MNINILRYSFFGIVTGGQEVDHTFVKKNLVVFSDATRLLISSLL